jgi:hypothetical protein
MKNMKFHEDRIRETWFRSREVKMTLSIEVITGSVWINRVVTLLLELWLHSKKLASQMMMGTVSKDPGPVNLLIDIRPPYFERNTDKLKAI